MRRLAWIPALLLPLAATAQMSGMMGMFERLDDSLSPDQNVLVHLDWLPAPRGVRLSNEQFSTLIGAAPNVEVRLDTRRFVGRRARIYLGLPVQISGLMLPQALRLAWTTRGRFEAGEVFPGQRTLLFEGPIKGPLTGDVLDFTVTLDAREMTGQINLALVYEIQPL